jgi:hypothetical protein
MLFNCCMMVPSSPRDVIGQFGPESLHARNVQSSTLFCYKRVRFVFWLSPAIPTTEPALPVLTANQLLNAHESYLNRFLTSY